MPKVTSEQVKPGDLVAGDRLFWGGDLTSEVVSALAIDTTTTVIVHRWPGHEGTRLQLPSELMVNRIIEANK
jgi:hypothetical protein